MGYQYHVDKLSGIAPGPFVPNINPLYNRNFEIYKMGSVLENYNIVYRRSWRLPEFYFQQKIFELGSHSGFQDIYKAGKIQPHTTPDLGFLPWTMSYYKHIESYRNDNQANSNNIPGGFARP